MIVEIKVDNDKDVSVSFGDIKEAFGLGIESIEDICRIKQKYGSIRVVLEQ